MRVSKPKIVKFKMLTKEELRTKKVSKPVIVKFNANKDSNPFWGQLK